jgi:predicted amidophosphoribosyltransferase
MDCPRCSSQIRGNGRNCPTCGNDVGFPNVRAATEYEEKAALAKRYENALQNAAGRACPRRLSNFSGR